MEGYLIKYALKTLKINQEQLAKKLKVSKATIAQWKNDKSDIPYDPQDELLKTLGLEDYGEHLGACLLVPLCGSEDNVNAYREALKQILETCANMYEGMWHEEEFLGYFGTDYTLFPILDALYKYKCPIPDGQEFNKKLSEDKIDEDDAFVALAGLFEHFAKAQVWNYLILEHLPLEPHTLPTDEFESLFADYLVSKRLSQLNSEIDAENRKHQSIPALSRVEDFIEEIIKEHQEKGYGIPYDLFQLLSDDPYFLEEASVYKKPEGMDKYITWGERKILWKLWEAELARHYISKYGDLPEMPF